MHIYAPDSIIIIELHKYIQYINNKQQVHLVKVKRAALVKPYIQFM